MSHVFGVVKIHMTQLRAGFKIKTVDSATKLDTYRKCKSK